MRQRAVRRFQRAARPDFDHLGIDILPVVIRYATRRANQRGLWNARFAVIGGFEFLEKYVAPGTLTEVHVYHAQPYRDAEKIERRLLTPEFLALVHRSLVPEGLLVLQSDNEAYWRYTASVAPRMFDFHEQPGPWPDAPEGRTRREIMARRMGLRVFRGWGRARKELDAVALAALVRELPAPTFQATQRRRGATRGKRRRK